MDTREKIEMTTCSDNGCKQIEVPTEKEVAVLNAMREIKDRVRDLKKEMALLNKEYDAAKITELSQEMDQLRSQWSEWERKRDEAAKERMILLGHEEP